MELINQITMLSIILTGAALIKEREHGTIEHLMVMPVSPFQIMVSKVWAMALVVLVASAFSLTVIIKQALAIPTSGSLTLFLFGTALHLFATTSIGIFLGTYARSMPQFGLLFLLIIMPMQILSGGFGTLDELFETLTLVQTKKSEPVPIVLVGSEFWRRAIDFDLLVEEGTIAEYDLDLFQIVDSAEDAWQAICHCYDLKNSSHHIR